MPGSYLDHPLVDEHEIQGDVLIGLQKTAEMFTFFEIKDVALFRADLVQWIGEIATLHVTRLYEKEIEMAGDPGHLPLDKTNIAFSYKGLKLLGLFTDADDGDATIDLSFQQGQKSVATTLGDDLAKWQPAYVDDARIHGVLLTASWRPKPNHALIAADDKADAFLAAFTRSVTLVHKEPGKIRSGIGADGIDQQGHEHFGFADGVSQPGVKGLTAQNDPDNLDQGFPGQDLVAPGEFVFGLNYPTETSDTTNATPPRPWMANGSYMVFRRLSQDVAAFRHYTHETFHGLATDPKQFAARIIGRWQNGSPVVIDPAASNDADSEDFPARDNNFDFGPTDPANHNTDFDQQKCPFASHIRRMYMRSDADDDKSEQHRILRAGIAFGDDHDAEKGLLFVCYQTSIVNKFEFIQKLASNPTANDAATGGLAFAAGMSVPAPPAVIGVDLVLAKTSAPRVATWATGTTRDAPAFVTATGGGYFFTPSISALKTIATGH